MNSVSFGAIYIKIKSDSLEPNSSFMTPEHLSVKEMTMNTTDPFKGKMTLNLLYYEDNDGLRTLEKLKNSGLQGGRDFYFKQVPFFKDNPLVRNPFVSAAEIRGESFPKDDSGGLLNRQSAGLLGTVESMRAMYNLLLERWKDIPWEPEPTKRIKND